MKKSIKEYQKEFEKLYTELRTDLDCYDLDIRIHQNDFNVIVNFDIR